MTRRGVTPEVKGTVGAGWLNPDGSISIKLEPFVVLSSAADLVLTLFANDRAGAAFPEPPAAPTPPKG